MVFPHLPMISLVSCSSLYQHARSHKYTSTYRSIALFEVRWRQWKSWLHFLGTSGPHLPALYLLIAEVWKPQNDLH